MNYMYRACGDGPMFEYSHQAAEWLENNTASGTTWIATMVWCSDCQDWVEESGKNCQKCGALWYDETGHDGISKGTLGYRHGPGKAKWQALQAQRKREQEALRAWNAGLPIR